MSARCRHCQTLLHLVLDLGFAPPSNSYLSQEGLNQSEVWLPLKLAFCPNCFLVQIEDFTTRECFFNADYAYFSSTSKSWVEHAKVYSEKIIQNSNLGTHSFVVEIASNDGYLLQNFVRHNIPCLGIEPSQSTAQAAIKINVPTESQFFGAEYAKKLAARKKADLIIGNNVFAHVPDINDFALGLKHLLAENGTITLEFPHLLNLIQQLQFDTIYHEHYSYLSLLSVTSILKMVNLKIIDVEKLPTHGGSLRVYIAHENDARKINASVFSILKEEEILKELKTYTDFSKKVKNLKWDILKFLIECKMQNKKIHAYGAAAKGNTLLNFLGIHNDLIECVYDAAKAKQNQFLPGSHIPILPPEILIQNSPEILIVLPWNIAAEITQQYQPQLPKTDFYRLLPTIQKL